MGGFFGVVSEQDCIADLFYGTDYHSHLGTQRGGMVTLTADGFVRNIHDITNTPFRTKFEDDLHKHSGGMGIGIISDYEDQPLLIGSHHGVYSIVTVGRIANLEDIAKEAVTQQHRHFVEFKGHEYNPTEIVATLIDQGTSITEGIRYAQQAIQGSCSMLLLTSEGIYAARDRLGRTPIVIGRKDGAFAITQETCAFPNLDYEIDRYLGPGEIVRITPEGVEVMSPPGDKMQVCTFLWIYYGYPASNYENINTEDSRNRCGAALARRDDVTADVVSGIPDSGVGHAMGYAIEAGIPYRRPFVKYTPTWPRSFMPQEQRVRDLVARMKLIPVREIIDGQSILFCEDSIVRGTQLGDIVQRLYDYGARQIHMRPACPPLVHGCPFLNFSRSKSEMDLAARRAIEQLEGHNDVHLEEYVDPDSDRYHSMVEVIRNNLGLTTLRYQRLDDMIDAIGLPADKLCTHCWNKGSYF